MLWKQILLHGNKKCFCLKSKTFLLPRHKFLLPKHMLPSLATLETMLACLCACVTVCSRNIVHWRKLPAQALLKLSRVRFPELIIDWLTGQGAPREGRENGCRLKDVSPLVFLPFLEIEKYFRFDFKWNIFSTKLYSMVQLNKSIPVF